MEIIKQLYKRCKNFFVIKRRFNKRKILIAVIPCLVLGIGISSYYIAESQRNRVSGLQGTETPSLNPTMIPELTPTTVPVFVSDSTPISVSGSGIEVVPTTAPAPEQTGNEKNDIQEEQIKAEGTVKVKGIYVTAPTTGIQYMQKLIDMAEATEINAMVIDVKDDQGKVTYKMDSRLAKEIGAVTNTISDINTLISTLKNKNIYLIARIVAFKDPYLAEQRQDLAIRNQDGSIYRDNNKEGWVNPYKTEVWDYLVEIATQAAAAGFDEIQFDYIRFSTGKGIANADFGEEAKDKTREEVITEFTKYAYEALKPLGVNVSADVYGTIINSSVDAAIVGQNYVSMAKYLDYICPMIYPSHFGEGNYGIPYPDMEPYRIIHEVLKASVEKLNQIPEGEHRAIVRPWLQDFTASWIKPHINYGGTELRAQIDGVYSVGYEEWLVWNSGCRYSEEGLEQEE